VNFVNYLDLKRQCPASTFAYEIQSGDTLNTIAIKFNTTVDAIVSLNIGIDQENLRVGQMVCIPEQQTPQHTPTCPIGTSPYEIKKGDTIAGIT
jgi:LysM repeat protein